MNSSDTRGNANVQARDPWKHPTGCKNEQRSPPVTPHWRMRAAARSPPNLAEGISGTPFRMLRRVPDTPLRAPPRAADRLTREPEFRTDLRGRGPGPEFRDPHAAGRQADSGSAWRARALRPAFELPWQTRAAVRNVRAEVAPTTDYRVSVRPAGHHESSPSGLRFTSESLHHCYGFASEALPFAELAQSPGFWVPPAVPSGSRCGLFYRRTANVVETAATRRWLFRPAGFPLFTGSTGLTRKLSS